MHRRIGWATGLCMTTLVALIGIGCDKSSSSGGASSGTSATAPQKPAKVLTLSVEQFADKFKDWLKDGINAPKSEESQGLFEITGVVDRVDATSSNEGIVYLKPASDTDPTEARQNRRPYIQALLNDHEPWARLARGQRATIRGKLGALPAPPNVEDADIIDVGPSTAIKIAAIDLASHHSMGEEELRKLYDDKDVIVTGTVTLLRSSPTSGLTLFLDNYNGNKGKIRVRCDLGFSETQRLGEARAPKEGQTVTVFGEVQPGNLTEAVLPMKGCRLITK
jgi:hypothetical protein